MAESNGLRALAFIAAVAVAAGGLIALSHELSRDRIAVNERARLLARLDEVLGPVEYDNDIEASRQRVAASNLLGSQDPAELFVATRNGRLVAVVFQTVAPHGYNGPIRLLVGVTADGRISGVRVTAHRETPGLGDAIEAGKSDWIEHFDGHGLGAPPAADWRVVKDGGYFDAITGATVTPRAVTEAVRNALMYFRDHRDEIVAAAATRPTDND